LKSLRLRLAATHASARLGFRAEVPTYSNPVAL
jgi:hypothetical protein